jgi:acylphosphatase
MLILLLSPQSADGVVFGSSPRPRPLFAGAQARSSCVAMGGLEQKQAPLAGGARVSLLLEGADAKEITKLCRSAPIGVTGIVYALQNGRLEVIGEGGHPDLEQLVEAVGRATAGSCGVVREAWQLPVGGYQADFPLVTLAPKMTAKITLTSADAGTIDYIARHVQTEAVFNRGLQLTAKERNGRSLFVECTGQSERLKSFVRWCYNGPALARADDVEVRWEA